MAKRLREHVKYTIKELDQYTQTEGSCVRKVNTNLHLSMGPFSLVDFKHILLAHLVRSKVGYYDVHLDGIVLDIKNVKVLGTTAAMRADDPKIHVNVNADVYLFAPAEGAELSGVVKHIGAHHVGVVLYRVFNANLRVSHKVDKDLVQMDQSVKFRVRNYNLQNIFPYIDGELLTAEGGETSKAKGKKIVFKDNDNVDSGIEEKEGIQELDELLTLIKTEEPDDYENTSAPIAKSPKKRTQKLSDSMESSNSAETHKKSKKRKTSHEFSEFLSEANDESDSKRPTKKSKKRSKKHLESETSNDLEIESMEKFKKKTLEEEEHVSIVKSELIQDSENEYTSKKSSKQSKKHMGVNGTPNDETTPKKKSKKNSSKTINNPEFSIPLTPSKIKKESAISEDEMSNKREKKSKTKAIQDIHIKEEFLTDLDD